MTTKAASRRPAAARLAPEIAYLALDMAMEKHHKPLSELSDEIAEQLLGEAHRRFRLERRMLASTSGLVGQVPASTLQEAENQIRERYADVAEFRADLERNGMDIDGLRVALRHSLRVEAVRAHVRQQAPAVDEVDASLYYQAHRDDFSLPETRVASHILVTINPAYAENTETAAARRIADVRAQIADNKASFDDLAMRHSECPTALEGGSLGRLRRGALYPELDKVLFTLGEGELSDVVRSPLGLHILRCDRIHPPRVIDEERALPRIRAMLEKRQQDAYEQAWMEALQAETGD